MGERKKYNWAIALSDYIAVRGSVRGRDGALLFLAGGGAGLVGGGGMIDSAQSAHGNGRRFMERKKWNWAIASSDYVAPGGSRWMSFFWGRRSTRIGASRASARVPGQEWGHP